MNIATRMWLHDYTIVEDSIDIVSRHDMDRKQM